MKCGVLVTKKGKMVHQEIIKIPFGGLIKKVDADNG